ncbi:MAG: ABC transporter ATP-binding protein, partial [Sphingopyxis sp.]|nr:ABC transporter ATP-binding protein [Sphingopyxis sp.]
HIVQVGTPQALYADPADVRVAEMLGSPAINLLDGVACATGVEAAGQVFALSHGLDVGTPVRLGFRPEHARIRQGGEGAGSRLLRTENLGAERLLHLGFADGGGAIVRVAADEMEQQGPFAIQVMDGRLLLFDSAGARLRS